MQQLGRRFGLMARGGSGTVSDLHYPLINHALVTQSVGGVDTDCAVLRDLAVNSVKITSNARPVQLTFPIKATGKARDFIVRLEITSGTAPTITFAFQDGENINFEYMEDWAVIDPGVTLLSFTETK